MTQAFLLIITVSLRILAKAAAILSFLQFTSAATLPPTTNISSNISSNIEASPDNFGWVRFCNDLGCMEDCGQWVSVDNPGCLQERGRHSFMFRQGTIWPIKGWGMVYTTNDQCSCQSECLEYDTQFLCHELDHAIDDNTLSFRLLSSEGPNGPCYGSTNNC